MIGIANPVAPVNQLNEPTNGGPDEAAQENCVAAVYAWAVHQLTGNMQAHGDTLRDAVYPDENYTGPTDPASYVGVLASYGVRVAAHTGLDAAGTLAGVLAALAAGHPCLATIPSEWGLEPPPTTGTTHVVAIVNGSNGNLTAMNPWGGFWQTQPEAWWQARFRNGGYFELSSEAEGAAAVWTIERDGQGAITGGHDSHGATVGAGMAAEIAGNAGLMATNAVLGESYFAPGQSIAVLTNWQWLDWFASRGTVQEHPDGGATVAGLYNLTASAASRIQALSAQVAQLQAQLATIEAANTAEEAAEAANPPADPKAEALVSALRAALNLPAA